MRIRLFVLAGLLAFLSLPVASASAAPEFTDPDPDDFTDDQGNFDQDGYVAALTHVGDGCEVSGDTINCSIQLCEDSTVVAQFDGAAVYSAPGTSSPFDFSFPVPAGTAPGTYTVSVGCNGEFLDFTVEVLGDGTVVGASLARTGSDTGMLVGVAAALIVLGASVVAGTKRRRATVSI